MKNFINSIQLVLTGIGGYLGYVLGGYDGFIYALITVVIFDFLSGVMVAIVEKKLSSEVGFRGIFKKLLIFFLVAIANILDVFLVKNGSVIRTAIIFFYLSNEGISILENCVRIGLPVPKKLKEVLEQFGEDDTDEYQDLP